MVAQLHKLLRVDDNLLFTLPPDLEAAEPPEARGLSRDAVRLMVSHYETDMVAHTQFTRIADHLTAGDVLVINTSGTLPAALPATRADGSALELHLSTHLPADLWLVEPRTITDKGTLPFPAVNAGDVLNLPDGGSVTLHTPYRHHARISPRLWVASVNVPIALSTYLQQHGFPIRYGYVKQAWPIEAYQTVYVTEAGSAEMPSAGRAFTTDLITRLVAKGVQVAPLILHTGVASLESDEPPYEEYYRVPTTAARIVNEARRDGRRVVAVGTTVIRALETVSDADCTVHPGEGWTSLMITPERGLHVVNGLLTGLHEPHATHLMMLEALAGRPHLQISYAQALEQQYLWHEFGDLHLILP